MNQCKHCGNKYSRSDNLKRHQISCKVKNKPETIIEAGIKQQQHASSGEVHNQQHNKTLNPKFSALIDSIVNEGHSPKKKKKDFVN